MAKGVQKLEIRSTKFSKHVVKHLKRAFVKTCSLEKHHCFIETKETKMTNMDGIVELQPDGGHRPGL